MVLSCGSLNTRLANTAVPILVYSDNCGILKVQVGRLATTRYLSNNMVQRRTRLR